MLCTPLGHAGTLGSAQWLHRPSRVYSLGESSNIFSHVKPDEPKCTKIWENRPSATTLRKSMIHRTQRKRGEGGMGQCSKEPPPKTQNSGEATPHSKP